MRSHGIEEQLERLAVVEVRDAVEGAEHPGEAAAEAHGARVAELDPDSRGDVGRELGEPRLERREHRGREVDAGDASSSGGERDRDAAVADAELEHLVVLAEPLGRAQIEREILRALGEEHPIVGRLRVERVHREVRASHERRVRGEQREE